MKALSAIVLLGMLIACGGDDGGPPTTPATPVPTPVPVTYDGTYTSTTIRVPGGAMVTASVSISHNGSNLAFGNFEVTDPWESWYGMGRATLTDNAFDGTFQYGSSSCGTATNHYTGWFSANGDLMNITCTITSNCADWTMRGEMRRSSSAASTRGQRASRPRSRHELGRGVALP